MYVISGIRRTSRLCISSIPPCSSRLCWSSSNQLSGSLLWQLTKLTDLRATQHLLLLWCNDWIIKHFNHYFFFSLSHYRFILEMHVQMGQSSWVKHFSFSVAPPFHRNESFILFQIIQKTKFGEKDSWWKWPRCFNWSWVGLWTIMKFVRIGIANITTAKLLYMMTNV